MGNTRLVISFGVGGVTEAACSEISAMYINNAGIFEKTGSESDNQGAIDHSMHGAYAQYDIELSGLLAASGVTDAPQSLMEQIAPHKVIPALVEGQCDDRVPVGP